MIAGSQHRDQLRHVSISLQPAETLDGFEDTGAESSGHSATVSHSAVEHFDIVGPYTLALRFEDGSEQRIDFRPVLEGEVFAPLQDLEMFNAVELDPTFGTVQWPNGADFDPETLHNWPKYRDELVAMARRWATASEPVRRTAG